jgi:hypothetical protein
MPVQPANVVVERLVSDVENLDADLQAWIGSRPGLVEIHDLTIIPNKNLQSLVFVFMTYETTP